MKKMDDKKRAGRIFQGGVMVFCSGLLAGQLHAQEPTPGAQQSQQQKIAEMQKALGLPKAARPAVPAAPAAPAAPASDEEEKVTIAFDNADVKDVIRWASDLTKKNIIVHPGVTGKKITVVAGDPMTREEAWQVFLSALQVNGLAVMESDDTVKILMEPDAKTEKIPVMDSDKKSGREDVVVRIVKVKNLAAAQLINLLKPLTPNSAHFAAYPETNTLIIADRAGNIGQIVDIITKIDQAGTIDIEILKLEFASAKDVAKILTELIQKTGGGKEAAAAPSQALNITSDERSNSILMTGDPVMRMQMRKIVQKLDLPLAGDGNTQVVYLNYITAKDIQPILEGIGGSAKKGAAGKEGGGPQEVEVSVQALEQTNAVVITAPPSMLNAMKGVIAKLDVRRQQVLVEAIIVEVSEDVSRELGVFWGTRGREGEESMGVFPSGSNANDGSDRLLDTLKPGGLSLGYFRDGTLRGLLRTLEGNTDTNVLSTPTIIALDNEEAKILVGESVPFKTGVERNNSTTTGTTGNISNKNTMYNNDFVQIDREDIGVQLKVTPRINQDGILTLEIEQKVESINKDAKVGGDSGASDIITNKREITTTALVKDDEVLVLGGLMRDEVQTSENGVPYLKEIPILGNLFKGKSKGTVKKNLMVFIHPRILRDDAAAAKETGQYYDSLRGSQMGFNQTEVKDYLHIQRPLPELDPWPHHHHNEANTSAAPQPPPVQVQQ